MSTHSSSFCLIYTTVSNAEQAKALIGYLLDQKLIGCGQMIPLRSLFLWENSPQQADEVGVLLKSNTKVRPALKQALMEHHPYDCPVILEIPVGWVNLQAAEWMEEILIYSEKA